MAGNNAFETSSSYSDVIYAFDHVRPAQAAPMVAGES